MDRAVHLAQPGRPSQPPVTDSDSETQAGDCMLRDGNMVSITDDEHDEHGARDSAWPAFSGGPSRQVWMQNNAGRLLLNSQNASSNPVTCSRIITSGHGR